IVMMAFTSVACQALSFDNDAQESGVRPVHSDYPMTVDAYNVLDVGDGNILYYTNLSLDEVMEFYRAEYESRGYIEDELLTVESDVAFSMVFDGDPSGRALVIQSVDLDDDSRSVTIRLEGE
ncbi:MAG TPA: hypothetical protein VK851_07965, partial [Anaerolineales bacterium]|nr:hypothetical protein [Anaerolineales bacterium]